MKVAFFSIFAGLVIGLALWAVLPAPAVPEVQEVPEPAVPDDETLEARFAELSGAGTNYCAGPSILDGVESGARLQGACCGAMDLHRYKEQVKELTKYSHIDKIPPDPYDIPVSLAEELLGYQRDIVLTPEQQAVYDLAMELSEEGGPCCCKCWRWYAFEGLAKYLIVNYDFSSEEIAELWELEDGCGGPGHTGDAHPDV